MPHLYKKPSPSRITLISLLFISCTFTLPSFADAVDIVEGVYELISRELSDGTVQKPPQIIGSLTVLKGHRNVNVLSTYPAGKKFSFSLVSRYTLTDTEFVETVSFRVINDEIAGKPPKYLVDSPPKSAPVKVQGNRVAFKPPFTRLSLVFDGGVLISTVEDRSVDTWKKVEQRTLVYSG